MALVLAAGLLGCGSGASPAATTGGVALTISDARLGDAIGSGGPVAAYLTISNAYAEADALIGASSPVAESVELHETSMDSSGMMGMHPVDRLEIPANGSVTLEPGGYHFMFVGLSDGALIAGSTIELDLRFEKAGTVIVKIVLPQG